MKKALTLALTCLAIGLFFTITGKVKADPISQTTNLSYVQNKELIQGTIEGDVGTRTLYWRSVTKYYGRAYDYDEENSSGHYYEFKPNTARPSIGILTKYHTTTPGISDDTIVWYKNITVSTATEDDEPIAGTDPVDPGTVPSTGSGESTGSTDTYTYQGTEGTAHDDIAAPTWKTVFGGEVCSNYSCWISKVWNWTLATLVPLATLIFSGAAVIYATSEGDSGRITLAKKMIVGVLSGIALLVLSRVLIYIILGSEGVTAWWSIFFIPTGTP